MLMLHCVIPNGILIISNNHPFSHIQWQHSTKSIANPQPTLVNPHSDSDSKNS